jgi:hypothetical protein
MLLLKQVHCLLNENVCIVTRVRIYCEILPEPSGNPLGSPSGFLSGSSYISQYIPPLVAIQIQCSYMHTWTLPVFACLFLLDPWALFTPKLRFLGHSPASLSSALAAWFGAGAPSPPLADSTVDPFRCRGWTWDKIWHVDFVLFLPIAYTFIRQDPPHFCPVFPGQTLLHSPLGLMVEAGGGLWPQKHWLEYW